MHLSKSSWLWKSTYYQYYKRIRRIILTAWGRSPTLVYRVLRTLFPRNTSDHIECCSPLHLRRAHSAERERRPRLIVGLERLIPAPSVRQGPQMARSRAVSLAVIRAGAGPRFASRSLCPRLGDLLLWGKHLLPQPGPIG